MRLAVFSDIHLEAKGDNNWKMKQGEVDIVILAGDIHTKARGVEWAKKTFSCPVIYVPGNHEGWGGHWENTIDKMKKKALGSHVHVLNNESIVLGGVRFIGSTLWTSFEAMGRDRRQEAMIAAGNGRDVYSKGLRDYRHIRTAGYRRIKTSDVYRWHCESKSYIERELSENFDGPSIVISHHAPLKKNELYGVEWEDILDAGYYSDMSGIIKKHEPRAWIFGHTHMPIHSMLEKTALISHPVINEENNMNALHQYVVKIDEGCNVYKVNGLFVANRPMETVIRNLKKAPQVI